MTGAHAPNIGRRGASLPWDNHRRARARHSAAPAPGCRRGGTAGVQKEDFSGDGRQFFEIVRDQDDGRGIGLVGVEHRLDRRQHLFAGQQIEAGGGFVEQDQPGAENQGAGNEAARTCARHC